MISFNVVALLSYLCTGKQITTISQWNDDFVYVSIIIIIANCMYIIIHLEMQRVTPDKE